MRPRLGTARVARGVDSALDPPWVAFRRLAIRLQAHHSSGLPAARTSPSLPLMCIPMRGFAPWPSPDGPLPRPFASTLSKTFPDPRMKVSGDIVASPELHLGGDGLIGGSLDERSIATPHVDGRG